MRHPAAERESVAPCDSRTRQFEADRRTITITQNSFETELSKDDRSKLYPSFGKLYPEGTRSLGQTSNVGELRKVVEGYGVRGAVLMLLLFVLLSVVCVKMLLLLMLFSGAKLCAQEFSPVFDDVDEELKKLENQFDIASIKLNRLSFEQCFHYGVFYSYVKLKEQEIRNIVWIAECIAQDQKAKINNYIPIF